VREDVELKGGPVAGAGPADADDDTCACSDGGTVRGGGTG